MKKLLIVSLMLCLVVFIPAKSEALILFDTGSGSGINAWGIDNFNQYAVQFLLGQKTTLTDLEFWVESSRLDRLATLKISLYGDLLNSPGNNLLFSDTFVAAQWGGQWQGLNGLSIDLNPDFYWLAIDNISAEIPTGTGEFYTVDASMKGNVPNPSSRTAFRRYKEIDPWGVTSEPLDFGSRIESNVIPEPATMLLFGTGMLGAFARRRKKHNDR